MSNTTSNGLGLPSVLTIVFVVMKLTHVIAWSWVWVLSPTWIVVTVAIGVVILLAVLDRGVRKDHKGIRR
jgi:hypothetical protein